MVYVNSYNPSFFQGFYTHCLQEAQPIAKYQIVFDPSQGFGVSLKGFYLSQFLWSCFSGVSYNVKNHAIALIDLAKARLNTSSQSKSLIPSPEFIAASKTFSWVIQNFPLSSTGCEGIGKRLLNDVQLECLVRAAELEGMLPLQLALKEGLYVEALLLLSQPGADFNALNGHLAKLLQVAVQEKADEALILKLLEKGAPIEETGLDIQYYLMRAIEVGPPAAANVLIDANSDLKEKPNKHALLLLKAVENRQVNVVAKLLDIGIDPDSANWQGLTALHLAARGLDVSMIAFLISKGANLAKRDALGRLPLQLPLDLLQTVYLPSRQVKKFYKKLFSFNPVFDANLSLRLTTSLFANLECNAESLVAQGRINLSHNPLEIAFLLHSESLAQKLLSCMSENEFRNWLRALREKYPQAHLELIELSPYTINRGHYKKGRVCSTVARPVVRLEIEQYLVLFDSLNVFDKNAPYYFDCEKVRSDVQSTEPNALRSGLQAMLAKITNRTAFLGTPNQGSQALEQFYQPLDYALQHVLAKLTEAKSQQESTYMQLLHFTMEELLRTMGYCGGKYFTNVLKLYLRLCQGVALSFEDDTYSTFSEFREVLFQTTIPNRDHSVHEYNFILRQLGVEYGLPASGEFEAFNDPFGGISLNEVIAKFDALYTPKTCLLEWYVPKLRELEFRNKYIDWCKTQIPNDWHKERFEPIEKQLKRLQAQKKNPQEIEAYLRANDVFVAAGESYERAMQSEKEASYLANCIFDMQTGELKRSGVLQALVSLGIFDYAFTSSGGGLFSLIGQIEDMLVGCLRLVMRQLYWR